MTDRACERAPLPPDERSMLRRKTALPMPPL
jgi:hypothetical protein